LASLILEDVKALRISEASIFHAFDVCAFHLHDLMLFGFTAL